jgi:hypothetical protein
MKPNTKIIHVDPVIHGQLKKFVLNLQLKGVKTSVSKEADTAISKHIAKMQNEK